MNDRYSDSAALELMINTAYTQYQSVLNEKRNRFFGLRHWSDLLDRWTFRDEKELLEIPEIPAEKRWELVESLSHLNNRSGYHPLFIKELETLILRCKADASRRDPITIVDFGAGSGGLLCAIYCWARNKNIKVELTAIDGSPDFVHRAQSRLAAAGIPAKMLLADLNTPLEEIQDKAFDIVISNYTVHHIRTPGQVALFFEKVYRIARQGWLIVDFERRFWGPFFVFCSGIVFGASRSLVSDGIKSIRRAWKASEINFILGEMQKAGRIFGMKCKGHPFFPYWMVKS